MEVTSHVLERGRTFFFLVLDRGVNGSSLLRPS
ncbi:hypothetical protein LINGRAHAP2_LOCUS8852 [Linum grandiflorum]